MKKNAPDAQKSDLVQKYGLQITCTTYNQYQYYFDAINNYQ